MKYLKRQLFGSIPTIKCLNCGYEGKSKWISEGSTGIEILLYCFMIFPGILYSLWRNSKSGYGCSKCRSDNIIKQ